MKKDNKKELVKKESLTLSEYEQKYSSKESSKQMSMYLTLAITVVAIFLFIMLFILFKEVYEINEYAGYAVGALGLLLYIFLFAVPVIKITNMRKFDVDVTVYSSRKAKAHNTKLREELAKKIVELYVMTEGSASIYSSESVERIIKAQKAHDKKELMLALENIYNNDVKKQAKNIISRAALRSGLYSAVSQKDTTDALLVVAVNLQMVKDILFLYGFRPSDSRLIKILSTVLTDALLAYGVANFNVGNTVVKTVGGAVEKIPVLGSVVSTLVDSSIQGLSNATLTAILGRQTIKYLLKEYNLQSILENTIESETDEEFIKDCDEIKKELQTSTKNKKQHKDNQDLKNKPSAV